MSPKPAKSASHSEKAAQSADKKRLSSQKSILPVTTAGPNVEQAGNIEAAFDEDGNTIVYASGDILLICKADEDGEACCFRVDSKRLTSRSKYFERLFSDTRFLEGATVANSASAVSSDGIQPTDSLPRIEVIDVGRISPVKSVRPLMTDLLLLLHYGRLPSKKTPLINLANLAVAADRFDASETLAEYIRNSNLVLRPKAVKAPLDEAALRQRLLIGLVLKDEELVSVHSKDLILRGSNLWGSEGASPLNDALWWDLPRNVEEELQARRGFILGTIWSLIFARTVAYTSRVRQCRLGYDTSPQCDSFHLGEFIRFLSRSGLLQFSSSLALEKPSSYCAKDVFEVLSVLRSCPSYQLDANHSHCGPRKQLMAGLRLIESCLNEHEIGICLECWDDRRNLRRSWSEGNAILSFDTMHASKERSRGRGTVRGHAGHCSPNEEYAARALFTADEKVWNLEANASNGVLDDVPENQRAWPTFGIK